LFHTGKLLLFVYGVQRLDYEWFRNYISNRNQLSYKLKERHSIDTVIYPRQLAPYNYPPPNRGGRRLVVGCQPTWQIL